MVLNHYSYWGFTNITQVWSVASWNVARSARQVGMASRGSLRAIGMGTAGSAQQAYSRKNICNVTVYTTYNIQYIYMHIHSVCVYIYIYYIHIYIYMNNLHIYIAELISCRVVAVSEAKCSGWVAIFRPWYWYNVEIHHASNQRLPQNLLAMSVSKSPQWWFSKSPTWKNCPSKSLVSRALNVPNLTMGCLKVPPLSSPGGWCKQQSPARCRWQRMGKTWNGLLKGGNGK